MRLVIPYICIPVVAIYYYRYILLHFFVLASLSRTWDGMGTTYSIVGVTLPELWARSVQCVARGKSFRLFLALGMDKTNPGVSATSSGMVAPHPLSPCTHVRFGCKSSFSPCRWYTYVYLLLRRAPGYDPAAQQLSSPLT